MGNLTMSRRTFVKTAAITGAAAAAFGASTHTALAEEKVQHAIEGKQIVKQLVVPGKIVNLLVK